MDTARATTALIVTIALLAAGLSGCANNTGNGPHAQALPPGSSCGSIRAELRTLDGRGVPSKVEALSAGRKMSEGDRALANRYNELLNQYLGARCHA